MAYFLERNKTENESEYKGAVSSHERGLSGQLNPEQFAVLVLLDSTITFME